MDNPAHAQIEEQTEQTENDDRHPDNFEVGLSAGDVLDKSDARGAGQHFRRHQRAPANPDRDADSGQNLG